MILIEQQLGKKLIGISLSKSFFLLLGYFDMMCNFFVCVSEYIPKDDCMCMFVQWMHEFMHMYILYIYLYYIQLYIYTYNIYI